jgi:hypothetical protein
LAPTKEQAFAKARAAVDYRLSSWRQIAIGDVSVLCGNAVDARRMVLGYLPRKSRSLRPFSDEPAMFALGQKRTLHLTYSAAE